MQHQLLAALAIRWYMSVTCVTTLQWSPSYSPSIWPVCWALLMWLRCLACRADYGLLLLQEVEQRAGGICSGRLAIEHPTCTEAVA